MARDDQQGRNPVSGTGGTEPLTFRIILFVSQGGDMQPGTKRRATPSEVSKQILELRQYHQQGCESCQSNISYPTQAKALGWTITKLIKARLFASEYSALDLDALCESLKQHRPVFGIAHIGLLVTLRGTLKPYRIELQEKCIAKNWSTEELSNEMLTTLGSRNTRGGRRPYVTADTALIVLQKKATTVRRLLKHLQALGITDSALSKKMRRRIKMLTMELDLTVSQACLELEQQRNAE
jgi:hypothetical protein